MRLLCYYRRMRAAPHLAWEGTEYLHNPKSADWYWALGIIAVASTIAAALFGNYLFSVLVVVAAIAIALHAAQVPPTHQFQITDRGLVIGNDLHPFEHIESFSVLEDIEGELPPLLSIKNDSWLSPHLVIPLENVDADAVYAFFLAHVDESAHTHTFTDVVAAWLGF